MACRSAGRVDGRADGRGLSVARAGPGVRVSGVRAARARRHVRQHGGADAGGAGGAAPAVRPPARAAAPRARACAARTAPAQGGHPHVTSRRSRAVRPQSQHRV